MLFVNKTRSGWTECAIGSTDNYLDKKDRNQAHPRQNRRCTCLVCEAPGWTTLLPLTADPEPLLFGGVGNALTQQSVPTYTGARELTNELSENLSSASL